MVFIDHRLIGGQSAVRQSQRADVILGFQILIIQIGLQVLSAIQVCGRLDLGQCCGNFLAFSGIGRIAIFSAYFIQVRGGAVDITIVIVKMASPKIIRRGCLFGAGIGLGNLSQLFQPILIFALSQ